MGARNKRKMRGIHAKKLLAMGPANDAPPEVKMEIRAAEIAMMWGDELVFDANDAESFGWCRERDARDRLLLAGQSPALGVADDEYSSDDVLTGVLAYLIAHHYQLSFYDYQIIVSDDEDT